MLEMFGSVRISSVRDVNGFHEVGVEVLELAGEDLIESLGDFIVILSVAQKEMWELEDEHPGDCLLFLCLRDLQCLAAHDHQDA